MIKFFRKIRQNLLSDGKTGKYFKYAIGEIVLVVIGILIALQINNWNEEQNQKYVLNDLLQSIANGVQSELRELNLVSAARRNIQIKSDSIFNTYSNSKKTSLNIQEASYINFAFYNILNAVHLNTNSNAFESLKNSAYFGKIQGTDLALLLGTYYTSANKIRGMEDRHNQTIENLKQDWASNFRNRGGELFKNPWNAGDFAVVGPRFLEILRDPHTADLFEQGYSEGNAQTLYQEQILMGKNLVDMIRDTKTSFDQQTKLELSGMLFSLGDADYISILINGGFPSGFDLRNAASDLFTTFVSKEKDYLVIEYPADSYDWASSYFFVNALLGRVNEMDFSAYSKVIIEMKGEIGGEAFEIAMKDVNDPPDGTESRMKIELTNEWKIYKIETKQFTTADMTKIMVPLLFVFQGPIGKKINIRSIHFIKD